ncbi:MAG: histidinol dehydrogenase [Pontiellaceae bacterium]|jgi:histidinol dehydrogenase|nr:histidinol dehydrogenase [Pontiellaceae bacterium]
MKQTDAPIFKYSGTRRSAKIEKFLLRPPVEKGADQIAAEVLAEIRKHGDSAVIKYVRQFDRAPVKLSTLRVSKTEIAAAKKAVDKKFKKAADEAHKRITEFAAAGLREDWRMPAPQGGWLGEKFVALDRIGAYIPGGAAPLASTALMTLTLAEVAGVPERVACTPAGADGSVNPYVLYALALAGATEIYRVGGIQAIGAMAYGTKTIRKVQKIVGPGGPYVTAAKRLVYGQVALDMVAGPSEIAVLADDTANPAHIAADLLSQAEHGTGSEKAMLVTPSEKLAKAVRAEVGKQSALLVRQKPVSEVLARGFLIVVVPTLGKGIELCNRFAPEHMEILVKNAEQAAGKIRTAGAIFMGPWTPEAVGDFAAGPSHVLPTGGTAAFFSGLTVEDFRRRISLIRFTKEDLEETVSVVEAFGRVETLDAHARSATIRLNLRPKGFKR